MVRLYAFLLLGPLALAPACATTATVAPARPAWLAGNERFISDGVAAALLVAAELPGRNGHHGGVGTVIDRDGHVLTAAHVVAGGGRIFVQVRSFDAASVSFSTSDPLEADLVAAAPEVDAAMIRVREPSSLPPPVTVARGRAPAVGVTAWFFGKRTACGFGPVTATREPVTDRISAITVDAISVSGDSGAPLILPGAGMVGMLFASPEGGRPSYFIRIDDALDALRWRRP